MEIKYKYKVGDKVTLTKYDDPYSYHRDRGLPVGKEVTIISRGVVYERKWRGDYVDGKFCNKPLGYEANVFYYIDEDSSYKKTRIPEDNLDGEDRNDIVQYDIRSADDKSLSIGDSVLDRVVEIRNGVRIANTRFVFAGECDVVGFRVNYETYGDNYEKHNENPYIELKTKRTFLCFYPPRTPNDEPIPCGDARMLGYESWSNRISATIYKELPSDYAELFVSSVGNMDGFNYGKDPLGDNDRDRWEIKQWLEHFGVYEEVKKLSENLTKKDKGYRNKTEKKSTKTSNKIKALLEGLSDEEKKELLKQLK